MPITLLNINGRSILNKINHLEAIFLALNPDIVVITETWLHSGVQDHEIVPLGCVIICKDTESRGEGVALILKNDFSFSKMPDIPGVEAIWCKVHLKVILLTLVRSTGCQMLKLGI